MMAPLSEQEIETIRKKLLPNADGIARDAEYQAARNVVWKHWKGLIIALAAVVAAVILIWDALVAGIAHLR